MCCADPDQALVSLDLDQHHEQAGLAATARPRGMEFPLEREFDDAAGDPIDLHPWVSDPSSRADSKTESSPGTKGSSYSMLIVPLYPWSRSSPMKRRHHSTSWPRPTVAKFQGISPGGFGQRLSSIPLRARFCS